MFARHVMVDGVPKQPRKIVHMAAVSYPLRERVVNKPRVYDARDPVHEREECVSARMENIKTIELTNDSDRYLQFLTLWTYFGDAINK